MAEPAEPSRLKIDYLARALSADLLAKYADGSITLRSDHLARGGLSLRQLSRVRDYVEAHLAEDIHVNDLAAIAGAGRTAFTTRFRASTGVTPYQYVMAARVERAKLLLTTARMPLADIAILCGFADQAHFATAFKRRTGRRPLDYRMR
nr:AraC family transcriptional regulator [Sphingomonas quercus]